MYGALDISTGGMIAQRARLDAIAANIVNKDTFLDGAAEQPLQTRRGALCPGDPAATSPQAGDLGVHVARVEEVDLHHESGNPTTRTPMPADT